LGSGSKSGTCASFAIRPFGFELGLVLGEAVAFKLFSDGVLDDLTFHVEGEALPIGTGFGSLILGGNAGRQVVEEAAAIGQDAPPESRQTLGSCRLGRCVLGANALAEFFKERRRRRLGSATHGFNIPY